MCFQVASPASLVVVHGMGDRMRGGSSVVALMLITALTVYGGWPATCQHRSGTAVTQADTTRPPMSTELNLPQDSVLTVAPPGAPDILYYRNVVGIAFVENASGRAVRAVLRKYHAVIIGGDPYEGPWGGYIVRIPDPGPSMGGLELLLSRIEAEAAVAEASWVTYRDRFVPRTSSSNSVFGGYGLASPHHVAAPRHFARGVSRHVSAVQDGHQPPIQGLDLGLRETHVLRSPLDDRCGGYPVCQRPIRSEACG